MRVVCSCRTVLGVTFTATPLDEDSNEQLLQQPIPFTREAIRGLASLMTTAAICSRVSRSAWFGFRQTDHRDPQREDVEMKAAVSISATRAARAREELTIAGTGAVARFGPHARCLQQGRL